jgi:hypothetical protein
MKTIVSTFSSVMSYIGHTRMITPPVSEGVSVPCRAMRVLNKIRIAAWRGSVQVSHGAVRHEQCVVAQLEGVKLVVIQIQLVVKAQGQADLRVGQRGA